MRITLVLVVVRPVRRPSIFSRFRARLAVRWRRMVATLALCALLLRSPRSRGR